MVPTRHGGLARARHAGPAETGRPTADREEGTPPAVLVDTLAGRGTGEVVVRVAADAPE